MSKQNYRAAQVAKQLGYSPAIIERIKNAKSESEITRILHTAREAMK